MRPSTLIHSSIATVLAAAAGVAIWLYYLHEGQDLLPFTTSVVGFCIAVLALFVAVKTYTSIDSVDRVSKMEGNILDNEHYVTCLPELVYRFNDKDVTTLQDHVLADMEHRLKRQSHTAMEFADTLQSMVDLIVVFPAIYHADDADITAYRTRMQAIVARLERRKKALQFVSKGNVIQIEETIKLFAAVVTYQRLIADGTFNLHSGMLRIRGPLLRNPVTRTVYHDYFGLYYNKKAMHLVRKHAGLERADVFSIDNLRGIHQVIDTLPAATREQVNDYLHAACDQFTQAQEVAADDVMWRGFIGYNLARTQYFTWLLDVEASTDATAPEPAWLRQLDMAIKDRTLVSDLVAETLTPDEPEATASPDTHLQRFFAYEEELARLIRVNLQIASGARAVINYRGLDLARATSGQLRKAFQSTPHFPRGKAYQDGILAWKASASQEASGKPLCLHPTQPTRDNV